MIDADNFIPTVSLYFLTDAIPTNWKDEGFDVDRWLEDNAWDGLEGVSPDIVWGLITEMADKMSCAYRDGYWDGTRDEQELVGGK